MNATELATKMLEWEKGKRALDELGAEIEAEVLTLQKTQVVGNCRVTYSGGRAAYDYETPGKTAPKEIIDMLTMRIETVDWEGVKATVPDVVAEFTRIENKVDYKTVCKEAKIEPVVISTTAPSATIKLEK
jgi:hypothetical protein